MRRRPKNESSASSSRPLPSPPRVRYRSFRSTHMRHRHRTDNCRRTGEQHRRHRSPTTHHDHDGDRLRGDRAGDNNDDFHGSGSNHSSAESCKATDQSQGASGSPFGTALRIRRYGQVSTTKPMPTATRQSIYVKQNGRLELTARQQRQIKKTALRLEHGRHRKPVNRPSGERATKGRKRAYADWLRDFYRSQLRGMRRQNRRAKLGRYTAGRRG
jgi:hypothetical protein